MFHYAELLWQIAKEQNRERLRDAEQWRLSHSSRQPTWLSQQLLRWLIHMSQQPQQTDRCQHGRLTA
jgi:hypothetical protein